MEPDLRGERYKTSGPLCCFNGPLFCLKKGDRTGFLHAITTRSLKFAYHASI